MTLYRANFDYESELFWGKRDNWAVELLEHLFFFCCHEDEALYTYRNYPQDYLKYIKSLTGKTPQIKHYGTPQNWWGKIEDINTERRVNSKVTSFEIGKNLEFNHSKSKLITSISELEQYIEEQNDIFLRHPYERSGRASFRINCSKDFLKQKDRLTKTLQSQPLIGDIFIKNRQWDLGTCFAEKDQSFEPVFQIKNLNDKYGVFRGGVLLDDIIETPELQKIGEAYYKIGARDALQVDSFAHDQGVNWLCEVNYRRTMGYVIDRLKKLVDRGDSVALLMTPSSWIFPFGTIGEVIATTNQLNGVIPLSPPGNHLLGWLIHATSREELLTVTMNWWDRCALHPERFPDVFNELLPNEEYKIQETAI